MKYAISVKNLFVNYERNIVLQDVSFEIPVGVVAAIVGPNGAGKSTLISAMLGFVSPKTGEILFFDQEIKKVRTSISYIPQKSTVDLDFPIIVHDVVLMGRYPHRYWYQSLTKEDYEITKSAIDFVGLTRYQYTPMSELSGGQQQLCFLARSLCQNANLLILDEPFVGVDEPTEKRLIKLLKQLAFQGKTVVIVHHDLTTILAYFDFVVFLHKKVIGYGNTAQLLENENYIKNTYAKGQRHV